MLPVSCSICSTGILSHRTDSPWRTCGANGRLAWWKVASLVRHGGFVPWRTEWSLASAAKVAVPAQSAGREHVILAAVEYRSFGAAA